MSEEELFTFIKEHHLAIGETIFFKCPHCSKEIVVELKTLEGDSDTIEVYWGKSSEDIEDKRKRVEKEIKES